MNTKSQLAIGLLLGIGITTLGFILYSRNTTSLVTDLPLTQGSSPSPTQAPAVPETDSEKLVVISGLIEGTLTYPSEGIPDTLQVCALNTLTQVETCTNDHVLGDAFSTGVGYTLSVEPGSYVVYANVPDSDYRAYYSEAVTCGLTVDCTDHTPIVLKIKAGKIGTADPGDWYDTSQQ